MRVLFLFGFLAILGCNKPVETSKLTLPHETIAASRKKIEPAQIPSSPRKELPSALEFLGQSQPPTPIEISPEQRAKFKEREAKEAEENAAYLEELRSKEKLNGDSTSTNGMYDLVVASIKQKVLEDTIRPETAVFCSKFATMKNGRGNHVYVGWYTSKSLNGTMGKDNIIAEVDEAGNILKMQIGGF